MGNTSDGICSYRSSARDPYIPSVIDPARVRGASLSGTVPPYDSGVDDELKDFRMPRPPWVEREHDWLAPFAEIGKALAPIDGQGIVTSVPITNSPSSLTMDDLAYAIAKLREHGFPGDRRTIRCGSEEFFRR